MPGFKCHIYKIWGSAPRFPHWKRHGVPPRPHSIPTLKCLVSSLYASLPLRLKISSPFINSGWRHTDRAVVISRKGSILCPWGLLRKLIIIFADYISGRIESCERKPDRLPQTAFQTHAAANTPATVHIIQYARLYLRDHEYRSLSSLDRLSLGVPCDGHGSSSSRKGTSGFLHTIGSHTIIFAVLKA